MVGMYPCGDDVVVRGSLQQVRTVPVPHYTSVIRVAFKIKLKLEERKKIAGIYNILYFDHFPI